ncbi:ester cyclase [Planococcus sp. N028]|uniref:Ester cyclase n=1 Tax=Planococcus shixiaomingii TaxID=3058393 RepID=A0ABT8N4V8_9BACL|nr:MULTISPECIES: ester cyclase [unclassified Planococcus (in: firmicutes)]MDN7242923.1 ester cyclase [Planococcus sp. N028]WKA55452.1 ester cyclase [Planococcus sp. N022]
MISPGKKMVAERWFHEYFTQGNVEVIEELTTEDFVYHARDSDHPKETMKSFMKWFRSVFHDDEWELNDFIEQENKLVVRYTGWLTYKGGWFGIPPNNQRVKETGMMIFKFEGERVNELWCENSDAAILYELGALKKAAHEVY